MLIIHNVDWNIVTGEFLFSKWKEHRFCHLCRSSGVLLPWSCCCRYSVNQARAPNRKLSSRTDEYRFFFLNEVLFITLYIPTTSVIRPWAWDRKSLCKRQRLLSFCLKQGISAWLWSGTSNDIGVNRQNTRVTQEVETLSSLNIIPSKNFILLSTLHTCFVKLSVLFKVVGNGVDSGYELDKTYPYMGHSGIKTKLKLICL